MIKTILSYVKEYKKASILAPIFMVGEVSCEMMLPFLMGFIIDKGIYGNNINATLFYGALMIIAACLSLFFGASSGVKAAYASCGLAKNLRSAMFKKIQTFSFKNTDKYSTSGLVTRMMTDVTNTQNAYQMTLRMCVRAPLTLIFAMIMTIYISPKLAMIFLVALIVLGVALAIMIKSVTPIFNEAFKRYDGLNSSVQENISNIRVVKAYVKENDEITKFQKASLAVYESFFKAESILVFNSPVMMLCVYGSMIAISWIGAHLIVAGEITTGNLMSTFTYTMSILMSLMMLSMIFVMMSMSIASAKRISEILNEEVDITSPVNGIKDVEDGSIEFRDVKFKYNSNSEEYNLNNINLKINSGETIGVIGGTGSAKSTLVSLIARLYDVNDGEVLVSGHNVKDYDLKVLRDNVAMVLQKNVLFSGSIFDNLRWGNEFASDEECIEASKLACAHEFVSSFPDGYNTYIEQGGSNVSGGQKQRLCIARAILKNPKIIILDDSTSAVDTRTDYMIKKSLKDNLKDTTKIIISQRISSIEEADRIIVMDDGHIDDIGTHEYLLEHNAIYKDIANTQSKGGNK